MPALDGYDPVVVKLPESPAGGFQSDSQIIGGVLACHAEVKLLRRETLMPQIQQHIDNNFPNAQAKVWRFQLGPGGGSKIEAAFLGPDPKILRQLADQAKVIMVADGGAGVRESVARLRREEGLDERFQAEPS